LNDPAEPFRNRQWSDVEAWRPLARQRLLDRLPSRPAGGDTPQVSLRRRLVSDGPSSGSPVPAAQAQAGQALHVEELAWQLPYGPPSEAIFIKPAGASGQLPAVLALHDHAANKYFGRLKIARAADERHPLMPPFKPLVKYLQARMRHAGK